MIVGVDPGRKTGIAVYDETARKLVACKTLDWWDAIDYLMDAGNDYLRIQFIVEDPSQNKPTFTRGLPDAMRDRVSQNVGANKEMARLMIERLRLAGHKTSAVRPSRSKWNDEAFRSHFTYSGRVSQHARDAARLIHEHYVTNEQRDAKR